MAKTSETTITPLHDSAKTVVYLITGPTSSGKTEYAVKLAKKLGGEIISADSRQVYRGLRIGAGAPALTRGMYKGIRHHLIGVAPLTKLYTAFDFQRDAYRLIEDIQKRKKIPLVVGGTGLWIRALKEGLNFAETKPNAQLRKQLEREWKKKGLDSLVKKCQKLKSVLSLRFPEWRKAALDYHNPRRVIRAIEILTSLQNSINPKKQHRDKKTETPRRQCQFFFITIHLSPPKDVLHKRINRRVEQMIKDGLEEEVKSLLRKYKIGKPRDRGRNRHLHPESLSNILQEAGNQKQKKEDAARERWEINQRKLSRYPALTGIGYREIIDYLQGKTTLAEAIELIKLHTRQYAKRQMTWLKKYA